MLDLEIWFHLHCVGYALNRIVRSYVLVVFSFILSGLVNCFVQWQEIAEYYESDQNIKQAITYFEKAAEFFQSEEVSSSANQCKLKIAQYAAQLQQ